MASETRLTDREKLLETALAYAFDHERSSRFDYDTWAEMTRVALGRGKGPPWTMERTLQAIRLLEDARDREKIGETVTRLRGVLAQVVEALESAVESVDAAYQDTGYIKIADTSHERIRYEAALAAAREALGQGGDR